MIFAVIAQVHNEWTSNAETSNISLTTEGYNAFDGSPISTSSHYVVVVPPESGGLPFTSLVDGSVMFTVSSIYGPSSMDAWVTTTSVFTGIVLGLP